MSLESLPKMTSLESLNEYTNALKQSYLKKTDAETMIKKAVAESGHARFEKADTLPSAETAEQNVLYLVPNAESGVMDIYAKIGEGMQKLADTNIDLSGYVLKESGKELIATEKVTKLDGIAENATKVEMGTEAGTILINGEAKKIFEVATDAEVQAVINELIGTEATENNDTEV